jgi:hypothetical protein
MLEDEKMMVCESSILGCDNYNKNTQAKSLVYLGMWSVRFEKHQYIRSDRSWPCSRLLFRVPPRTQVDPWLVFLAWASTCPRSAKHRALMDGFISRRKPRRCLTTAILRPANNIVADTRPVRILGLNDWEQLGWDPYYQSTERPSALRQIMGTGMF